VTKKVATLVIAITCLQAMRKEYQCTILITVLHLFAYYLLNVHKKIDAISTLTINDRAELIFYDFLWALCQMLRSSNVGGGERTSDLENIVYDKWEQILRLDADGNNNLLPIKVYDARNFDPTSSDIDLDKPFIITNNDYDADEKLGLTSENMMNLSELSSIEINYFNDATLKNTIPDSVDKLGSIVTRVIRENAPHKFGTEKIFQVRINMRGSHPSSPHFHIIPHHTTVVTNQNLFFRNIQIYLIVS